MVEDAAPARARILDAAVDLFREWGLNGASVRDIASAARADPALVIRYFGSKQQLFLQAMQVDPRDHPLFAGPLEQMGRGCIRLVLDLGAEMRATFLALLRGGGGSAVDEQLARAHAELFVQPLRSHLEGADADLRSRLAAALVGGLLYSLWVVGDEVLLAADRDRIVETYGDLLQRLITPER